MVTHDMICEGADTRRILQNHALHLCTCSCIYSMPRWTMVTHNMIREGADTRRILQKSHLCICSCTYSFTRYYMVMHGPLCEGADTRRILQNHADKISLRATWFAKEQTLPASFKIMHYIYVHVCVYTHWHVRLWLRTPWFVKEQARGASFKNHNSVYVVVHIHLRVRTWLCTI